MAAPVLHNYLRRNLTPEWVHYAVTSGVVADGVTDNADALDRAMNSFPLNKGRLVLPTGTILTSRQIEYPDTNFEAAILVEGAEKSATVVKALQGATSWSGKAVWYKGTTTVIGGGLKHLSVDGSNLADYAIRFRTGKQTILESVNAYSGLVTTVLVGDASSPRFYEAKFQDCAFYTSGSFAASLRPDYNLRFLGYGTDNEIFRVTLANAKLANLQITTGGCTITHCHAFGYPATHEADYCFDLAAGNNSVLNSYSDGFGVAGIHIAGGDSAVVACRFFWPSTITADAILVAANRTGLSISDNIYFNLPAGKSEVAYEGGLPSDSYIQSGLIKTDGARMFLGHTQSQSALNGARLQISGTDFGSSGSAIGRWGADALGAFQTFYKSRGAAIGDHGLLSNLDQLGIIEFLGDDGVQQRTAARIFARVDGTPAAGDMPGRLDFFTTPPGGTLTARLSIDSRGNVAAGGGLLATNATDGFLYIPTCAGVPTGVPRNLAGYRPIIINELDNKFYQYSTSAWREVGP